MREGRLGFIGAIIMGVVVGTTANAQSAYVHLNDDRAEHAFRLSQVPYYIDRTNQVTFEEVIQSDPNNLFPRNPRYQNVDFERNVSYWIRIPVRHSESTYGNWLVEFPDQTIDLLEMYIPQRNGRYRVLRTGDAVPFAERSYRHKNFETNVDIHFDTVATYYFRVRSHEFADIRFSFRSSEHFLTYSINEYFLFGTFYGMIVIISLYNFLIFLAVRERKYIYYIFYLLSVAGYALSTDGVGFQYLWPDTPVLNLYASGFFQYMLMVWSLVFTRRFLSTRGNSPSLDRLLKWLIIVRSAFFVVQALFFPQWLTYRNLDVLPLLAIFYTAIRVWRAGYKPARFFVIAYGLLFFGFFIRMLVYFNLLPFTTTSHYSLHFSFVLEMLFLTFALGDRIRILKDMRDRALRRIIHQHELNMQLKDKVNRELEQKVRERTLELDQKNHELEASNQKLTEQAQKISRINSMLDLDNWKLKSSIKEVLNERLHDKAMEYPQFKTLYPDDLACYRFLEELKWSGDFACRKCANAKFFAGAQKFARRCTRCGYNESITAFTVFHGIKFPIEKAFYIAYLTVAGVREQTLVQLAETLGVGVNTVWSFRQKVLSRLADFAHRGKKATISRWEEVILDTSVPPTKSKVSDTAVFGR